MAGLNEDCYKEIIDFLPDAMFVIDSSGSIIAWNRAMEEMTGVPASRMLGKGDYEYAIPFYGQRKPMLANLVMMGDEELTARYNTVRKTGDTLVVDIFIPGFRTGGAWFWAKARPLRDHAGTITGAIETIRDITDRKQAEQETEQIRARLGQIINFLPDATFVIDNKGVVIAWNRAMEQVTGVAATEMIGKGDHEYAIPFYGERKPMLADLVFMPDEEVEKRYHSIIRTTDALLVDIFLPEFGGRGTWFWAKASAIYNRNGEMTCAIETIRDITDRKQAELETDRARQRLAEIISFLPDPTFVIDRNGVVIAWNRALEELTGTTAEQMIGKGDYEYAIPFYGEKKPMLANLIFMPGEEIEQRYHSVQRIRDTLVVDIFIPGFRQGGAYFWAKASPLFDPDGNITGAIETIRDITDRILIEQKLARSSAELQIAAEIQQSFLPEALPKIRGFDIAARSVMAKEVGGDFFDVIPFEVIPLDMGKYGILIADVSGKGVPAALFMALSRIVVRVNALWHRDPAKAIGFANDIITQDSKAGMFVTLFYGSLSEKDRTLTYVNAGHNPPLMYRCSTKTFEELMPTGIFLGGIEHQVYSSRTVEIGPGDIVVLYTDGITESINGDDEMFGEDRLRSIILEHTGMSAIGIMEKILEEVSVFAVGQPQFDDITLMVIRGV
ncbi:MAG: PAS domain S-box protein [Methanoregulaceae archaeon]|nr:PAS domain S-box protein [Methanoregulaceae archaeon]